VSKANHNLNRLLDKPGGGVRRCFNIENIFFKVVLSEALDFYEINMSDANKFQRLLGVQLAAQLDCGFKFYKTTLELRRKTKNGHDIIILGGSNKWSPTISVSFHFGKRFNLVRDIEKKLNEEPMFYHIHHYSPNSRNMKGLNYSGPGTWNVDIRDSNDGLAADIIRGIEGIAFPFFERFTEMNEARDALACQDSWCIGAKGAFWPTLFKVDTALGDISHFREWCKSLTPFHRKQALEKLEKYEHDFNDKI